MTSEDLAGEFDSLEEAKETGEKLKTEEQCDWWHILDAKTGEVHDGF